MNTIFLSAGVVVLGTLAGTFAIGMIKTLKEGGESFDEFNRAGFTLKAFLLGRVPPSNAGSSLQYGESAEIFFSDGAIEAKTTRTVSKTLS